MAASGKGFDEIASRGPFSLIASDYGGLIGFLDHFADVADLPSLLDCSIEVLNLPPEERFTRSLKVFKAVYGIDPSVPLDETGPEDLDEGIRRLLERFGSDELLPRLFQFMDQQLTVAQGRLLDRLIAERGREEGFLVVITLHDRYRDALRAMRDGYYLEDRGSERLSPLVALTSWFVCIAAEEETHVTPKLLRDLARSEYYLERLDSTDPDWDPEQLPEEELWRRVRADGAAIAYDRRDISVNRGAELAKCSRTEFESVLFDRGIAPRDGPAGVDDLLDDPRFSKSA